MREQLTEPSQPGRAGRASRATELISKFTTEPLGYLGAITLLVMLLLTLVNVIQREITGRGIDGTIEYTEVLMVVAIFATLAIAQKNKTHIATSFITAAMPNTLAGVVNRLVGAIGAAVLAMFLFSGFEAFLESLTQGEYTMGVARVELWPGRLAIFVGIIFYAYEYLRAIVAGPSRLSVAEEAELEFQHELKRENDA